MREPLTACRILLLSLLAVLTACAAAPEEADEPEPVLVERSDEYDAEAADEADSATASTGVAPGALEGEAEVPLAVAEAEREESAPRDGLAVVVVEGRERHVMIRDLVVEAQALLRDVELEYFFTGKGKREALRGRPVAFALWSEAKKAWTIAHVEIPRPPVRFIPGRRPLQFRVLTPGVEAQHVKGTGAERLMFAFSSGGEALKVYGRKFPVFDNDLLKKKRWRDVVRTARPIIYLPFTEDALDPGFVKGGRDYLLSTARRAIADLRTARVPSIAYPGQLLADVVPPEVITTLAVIEQTDDADYTRKGLAAFEEVLNHYGLKREEAYRYSVSSAKALGPMQFTNRRGNGTYALVVRRCRGARIDPDFERGATDLYNAMKAAICLFDIELAQMKPELRAAYRDNPAVLGIFPVAAYNGGPRNVKKLQRVLQRMDVRLEDLRRKAALPPESTVACPCLWKAEAEGVRPVPIPRYNNENRWYVEKYQSILGLFE